MRLLQTLACATGFRDPAHNARRLGVLDALLAEAARIRTDLILLPGGYLSVRHESDAPAAMDEIRTRAHAAGIAVIGGIDGPVPADADEDALVCEGRLPFFGFAVGPVEPEVVGFLWRQSSTRNHHPELLPDDRVPGGERIVTRAGTKVGVLVCGELSNWRTRELFAAGRPSLVVDAGHISMGQGLVPGMNRWRADLGCAVAHAQHVQGWSSSHHFVAADGTRSSVRADEERYVGGDDFWVAWCAREV